MNSEYRVLRLRQLAEALERGQSHPLTRLTILKPLCESSHDAVAFARFGVDAAVRLLSDSSGDSSGPLVLLRTVRRFLRPTRTSAAGVSGHDGSALLAQLVDFQAERRRMRWGVVRVITSQPVLAGEVALRLALSTAPEERALLGYRLAAILARRYDPKYGDGLVPQSAPTVAAIADHFSLQAKAPNPASSGLAPLRAARR